VVDRRWSRHPLQAVSREILRSLAEWPEPGANRKWSLDGRPARLSRARLSRGRLSRARLSRGRLSRRRLSRARRPQHC
jgi:hypothetical protein